MSFSQLPVFLPKALGWARGVGGKGRVIFLYSPWGTLGAVRDTMRPLG